MADGERQPEPGPAPPRPLAAVVVIVNLLPVLGLLFFDWDAFAVVFLYWLENAIIGFFTAVKIALANGPLVHPHQPLPQRLSMPINGMKVFLIPFFLVHYGMFMLVHGVFVVVLLRIMPAGGLGGLFDFLAEVLTPYWIITALAILLEHAYLFYVDFLQSGQFRRTNPVVEMFAPYGRIVILHVAIIFGAWILILLRTPNFVAILLVILKVLYELRRMYSSKAATALAQVP